MDGPPPLQGVGRAPPVDVALHRGVLRAGRPRGRDGARVLAALRQEQHHGAAVPDRCVDRRKETEGNAASIQGMPSARKRGFVNATTFICVLSVCSHGNLYIGEAEEMRQGPLSQGSEEGEKALCACGKYKMPPMYLRDPP